MILFSVSMPSGALKKRTALNVLVPETAPRPRKVLWALHGMTDDHTGWLRATTIEQMVERYGIVVIMPNADLSFYVDMAYGAEYSRFLTEELPQFAAEYFGVSGAKEDNVIIGNSMGGYGAFYTAMNHPEKYAAAISLSGPMRIDWINRVLADDGLAEAFASEEPGQPDQAARAFSEESGVPLPLVHSLMQFGDACTARTFRAMFGLSPELRGTRYDIFHLADRLEQSGEPLKLRAFCGRQDYHYSSNMLFAEAMRPKTLDYRLTTGDGAHDWGYWNPVIESALRELYP